MEQSRSASDGTTFRAPNAGAREVWGRGGAQFGIFLIIAGVVLLAAQFAPGLAWPVMWPLIFVVIGLSQMVVPGHLGIWAPWQLLEGAGTVLFGAVLLGNTTGLIDWTMWLTFVSLWPAMLIAAGLGLLGKATTQSWLRVLGTFVMWAVLVYAAASGAGLVEAPSLLVPWIWI